jgi:malate synthase
LTFLEVQLQAPKNSFKITVIVESVLALSLLEEIVYLFRERIVGLNVGRWNYISSIVKRFKSDPILQCIESRHSLTTDVSFLQILNQYVVHIAHKRGIHAIAGPSSYVPRENQPKITEYAVSQVMKEKLQEAELGFDGAWVVHPLLVPTA